MERIREIPWPRILAEGIAIVVSILLAFGIEAWWSDRQDRKEELVILNSLLIEFETKLNQLEYSRQFNTNVRSSVKKLIDFGLSPDSIPNDRTILDLLNNLWWWNTEGTWGSPVLDAIINSDGGSLVSNPNLRATLANWPGRYEVVRELVRLDQELYRNHLWPYLIKRGSLAHIAHENEGAVNPIGGPAIYTGDYDYDLREPFDHVELLSDREFRNLLVEKSVRHDDILGIAFGGLDEQLELTIQAIRDELSR